MSSNPVHSELAKYRFGFMLSTALGNITRFNILKKYAERDQTVEFVWAPVKHYIAPAEFNPFSKWPKFLARRAIPIYQAWSVLGKLSEFDAVMVHMYEVDLILSARSYFTRNKPLIVCSTDDAPVLDSKTYPVHPVDAAKSGIKKYIRLRLDLWRTKRAALQIPYSKWAANILTDGAKLPRDKVIPIHVGLDLEQWHYHDRVARSNSRVKILFVGGDFVRKGGALLLDVFAKSFADVAELHLVSPQAPTGVPAGVYVYKNLSPQSDRLMSLYRECDIFALPTTSDMSPWVVLEAMASGCAVITTPTAGIAEMIVDGQTGIFVPKNDFQALAQAIKQLIENPAKQREIIRAARTSIEENFNAAINVPRILGVMKKLVDSGTFDQTSWNSLVNR
jgi:glycosyltransferase involved in cell wall biosynthesis